VLWPPMVGTMRQVPGRKSSLLPIAMNWRGLAATDPFPLLIERLVAFIAVVNGPPSERGPSTAGRSCGPVSSSSLAACAAALGAALWCLKQKLDLVLDAIDHGAEGLLVGGQSRGGHSSLYNDGQQQSDGYGSTE